MKSRVSIFMLILTFLWSCRQDENGLQKIDQVLQLYIKNTLGQDLLNSSSTGYFQNLTMKDIGGIRDQMSISGYSLKKDQNGQNYLEYIAGAKRNLTDSISADHKKYRSDMILLLSTSATDSVDVDTLSVFYDWTPQVFQIQTVNYNGKKVFTKTEGQPNAVTVIK